MQASVDPPRSVFKRHQGFTLVELSVSLVIISIIALVVFARSNVQIRNARVAAFADQFQTLDRAARILAQRQSASVTLRLKSPLGTSDQYGQVWIETADGQEFMQLRIPTGIRRVALQTDRRWQTAGSPAIEIFRTGQSADYAIRMEIGDDTERFLLFLGATGQCSLHNTATEWERAVRETRRQETPP